MASIAGREWTCRCFSDKQDILELYCYMMSDRPPFRILTTMLFIGKLPQFEIPSRTKDRRLFAFVLIIISSDVILQAQWEMTEQMVVEWSRRFNRYCSREETLEIFLHPSRSLFIMKKSIPLSVMGSTESLTYLMQT